MSLANLVDNSGRVRWTRSGLPMHPAVRRGLKIHAARHGTSMQLSLHSILVEFLCKQGLDPLPTDAGAMVDHRGRPDRGARD